MGCGSSSPADGAQATATANPLGAGQDILAPFLPVYRFPSAAGEEVVLRGLSSALEVSEACGRWCAETRAPWGNWGVTFPDVSMGQRRLQEELVAAVAAAPPALQAHVVATAVRAAQVWRAFEGFSGGGQGCFEEHGSGAAQQWPDVRTARALAAAQLLATLHGRQGQGPAKVAATAQCATLGAAMDAAWFAFPAAEREALRALPWEGDGEPQQVGVWARGDGGQNGKPIMRPRLRQRGVPAAFVPDDRAASGEATGGDFNGERYVAETLLPAARRVLPRLEEAARAVVARLCAGATAAQRGESPSTAAAAGASTDDHRAGDQAAPPSLFVPPLKTALRMAEKAGEGMAGIGKDPDHQLHEYPRQASNVDVARVMLVVATPAQAVRALALFKETCSVVRVKNRFSPEAPLFGYRDMLLNLHIEGVYCEVQIGLTALVAVRRRMHSFYGVVRSIGYRAMVALAKPLSVREVGAVLAAEAAAARAAYEDGNNHSTNDWAMA